MVNFKFWKCDRFLSFCHVIQLGHIFFIHVPALYLLDQSGVTGRQLDPYSVHALFVNIDDMLMERFGNYYCLVIILSYAHFCTCVILPTDEDS